jgi:hypothetical protein
VISGRAGQVLLDVVLSCSGLGGRSCRELDQNKETYQLSAIRATTRLRRASTRQKFQQIQTIVELFLYTGAIWIGNGIRHASVKCLSASGSIRAISSQLSTTMTSAETPPTSEGERQPLLSRATDSEGNVQERFLDTRDADAAPTTPTKTEDLDRRTYAFYGALIVGGIVGLSLLIKGFIESGDTHVSSTLIYAVGGLSYCSLISEARSSQRWEEV